MKYRFALKQCFIPENFNFAINFSIFLLEKLKQIKTFAFVDMQLSFMAVWHLSASAMELFNAVSTHSSLSQVPWMDCIFSLIHISTPFGCTFALYHCGYTQDHGVPWKSDSRTFQPYSKIPIYASGLWRIMRMGFPW